MRLERLVWKLVNDTGLDMGQNMSLGGFSSTGLELGIWTH